MSTAPNIHSRRDIRADLPQLKVDDDVVNNVLFSIRSKRQGAHVVMPPAIPLSNGSHEALPEVTLEALKHNENETNEYLKSSINLESAHSESPDKSETSKPSESINDSFLSSSVEKEKEGLSDLAVSEEFPESNTLQSSGRKAGKPSLTLSGLFGFGRRRNKEALIQSDQDIILQTNEGSTVGDELSGVAGVQNLSLDGCDENETIENDVDSNPVSFGKVEMDTLDNMSKVVVVKSPDVVEARNPYVTADDDLTCQSEGTFQTFVPEHSKNILTSNPNQVKNGTKATQNMIPLTLNGQAKEESTPSASWLGNLTFKGQGSATTKAFDQGNDRSLVQNPVQEYMKTRIQYAQQISINEVNSTASTNDNVKAPEDPFKFNKSFGRRVAPTPAPTQAATPAATPAPTKPSGILYGFCQDLEHFNDLMWDTIGGDPRNNMDAESSIGYDSVRVVDRKEKNVAKKDKSRLSPSPRLRMAPLDASPPSSKKHHGAVEASAVPVNSTHPHKARKLPNTDVTRSSASPIRSSKLSERNDLTHKAKKSVKHKDCKGNCRHSTRKKDLHTIPHHGSMSAEASAVTTKSKSRAKGPAKVLQDKDPSEGSRASGKHLELDDMRTKVSTERSVDNRRGLRNRSRHLRVHSVHVESKNSPKGNGLSKKRQSTHGSSVRFLGDGDDKHVSWSED